MGEHGEAKFGWGTDCMREREAFSGAWKLHRAGCGGGGERQGSWAVWWGPSRLKGRVDRPLAEVKLQP